MKHPKPKTLSRREFLKLSGVTSLGLTLSACGLRPTPMATSTLTSTSLLPTITPRPTATLTPTNTPTPTPTKAPSETPSPTDVPRHEVVFYQDTYDSGVLDPNSILDTGGIVEIVKDPTNSIDLDGKPRNKVLKITAKGPAQQTDYGGNTYWRNIHVNWQNGYGMGSNNLPAPAAIECDVYVPKDLSVYIGLLSFHRRNMKTRDNISVAGYEIDPDNGQLVLGVRDGDGNDTRVDLDPSLSSKGTWMRLRLETDKQGNVFPFVNNVLAYKKGQKTLTVPVDRDHPSGFFDGHAGIINGASTSPNDGLDGAFIYNDNFRVIQILT